jgi:hypothetical protein
VESINHVVETMLVMVLSTPELPNMFLETVVVATPKLRFNNRSNQVNSINFGSIKCGKFSQRSVWNQIETGRDFTFRPVVRFKVYILGGELFVNVRANPWSYLASKGSRTIIKLGVKVRVGVQNRTMPSSVRRMKCTQFKVTILTTPKEGDVTL